LTLKKCCHARTKAELTTTNLKKIVHMNGNMSETIKARKLGLKILTLAISVMCL